MVNATTTVLETPPKTAFTVVYPDVVLYMELEATPLPPVVEAPGFITAKVLVCVNVTVAPAIGVPRRVTVA